MWKMWGDFSFGVGNMFQLLENKCSWDATESHKSHFICQNWTVSFVRRAPDSNGKGRETQLSNWMPRIERKIAFAFDVQLLIFSAQPHTRKKTKLTQAVLGANRDSSQRKIQIILTATHFRQAKTARNITFCHRPAGRPRLRKDEFLHCVYLMAEIKLFVQ